jgi:hypothetical protein
MAESHEEEPGSGEEHLPGPSFWPVLLAVGVAMSLIGVITKVVVVVIGLVILVVALGGWIRDARRDYRSLS